ncbi:M48 family metallopeptidase [Sorangium sp. So ce1000]|uniref:M48 family metallopeptidase n=1 Tax=Sorangium sp. So ce1000 TaxID=3133325 RepID=UPI003F601748
MLPERSEVTWGTTHLAYEIRRSARRSTVSIAIDPALGLVVTAPQATPIARLDSVVRSKAAWIVPRLKRQSERPPACCAREFVSGESLLYLGRQARLRLLPEQDPRPLTLRGGWLELPLPRGLAPEYRGAYARAALIDWYKRHATERLPAWAEPWAQKLGVSFRRILVTDQEKRWGSCSRGVLRLNWRIVQAPRALVDYVLAHELTHLIHDRHGREFWATLGRVMPDYEARRARLGEIGPALLW